MKLRLDRLQPLGRALMLPIAVLPAAALLLRLGKPDMLDIAFVSAAGDAIFAKLGLLFAIGVAVGIAREAHGAAGLAGAVCFFVTIEGAKALIDVPPEVTAAAADEAARNLTVAVYKSAELAKLSVPAGILSGLAAGALYNRFFNIALPEYLAFFGGRRFVPIVSGFAGLLGAAVFGLGFPWMEQAIDGASRTIVSLGPIGLFIYGTLNRLLIVTGLHHIVNNIAWFIVGDFAGATGDLKRFFAGDPAAGVFMAGFFPVMMFGLPAACLAMYHSASPERRKGVAGMFLSLGLTSFLTGVTEPIEFTFMFLAPALYALHAALTGLSFIIMDALVVERGFGFSAALFDYVINYGISTRPLLLLPVGAAYFLIYYSAFRFVIRRFDLKTPGRGDEEAEAAPAVGAVAVGSRAEGFVVALGGRDNLREVNACTTRLRLDLLDVAEVDEGHLKQLGARGIVRPGGTSLQVVLGPIADQVAGEIRALLSSGGAPALTPKAPEAPAAADGGGEARPIDTRPLLQALGGRDNLEQVSVTSSRLLLTLRDGSTLSDEAVRALGLRGVVRAPSGQLHLVVGPEAENWAAALRKDAALA